MYGYFMKFSLGPVQRSHQSLGISTNLTQDHEMPFKESPESPALPKSLVNIKVYSMNWKIFLGFFALLFCRVFRTDCLKVVDIVNGLNDGAKYPTFYNSKGRKVKSFGVIFKVDNILEILASWQKNTFL